MEFKNKNSGMGIVGVFIGILILFGGLLGGRVIPIFPALVFISIGIFQMTSKIILYNDFIEFQNSPIRKKNRIYYSNIISIDEVTPKKVFLIVKSNENIEKRIKFPISDLKIKDQTLFKDELMKRITG